MLRHICDVLNENVSAFCSLCIVVLNEKKSNLLIIDTLIQPGVVSSTGPSLKESLANLDRNVYSPVAPPPFVPVNFGEASRNQNALNVGLSAICNGTSLQIIRNVSSENLLRESFRADSPTDGRDGHQSWSQDQEGSCHAVSQTVLCYEFQHWYIHEKFY
jgi:hypothetical protein